MQPEGLEFGRAGALTTHSNGPRTDQMPFGLDTAITLGITTLPDAAGRAGNRARPEPNLLR